MAKPTLEIKDKDYRIWYEEDNQTVFFEGKLRLASAEYRPIRDLLNAVLETEPTRVCIHIRDLAYLNSSGLTTLFRFVVSIRNKGSIDLAVRASKSVLWHSKAIANIERFFPAAEFDIL